MHTADLAQSIIASQDHLLRITAKSLNHELLTDTVLSESCLIEPSNGTPVKLSPFARNKIVEETSAIRIQTSPVRAFNGFRIKINHVHIRIFIICKSAAKFDYRLQLSYDTAYSVDAQSATFYWRDGNTS
jgi:hypothetical protein